MKPQDFYRMMQESKAIGFVDDWLTPLVPSFQQTPGLNKGGRPQKSDSQLDESGAETREGGQNISRGGKE